MAHNESSYAIQIGNKKFIVYAKQGEHAKKSLDDVFRDICKRELLSGQVTYEKKSS